jgi:hypothetical protein
MAPDSLSILNLSEHLETFKQKQRLLAIHCYMDDLPEASASLLHFNAWILLPS